MFNTVAAARFHDVPMRTEQVVESFVAAGRPWMWQLSPSYTSADLERVLERRGLERESCPGMYLDLGSRPATPALAGVEMRRTDDVGRSSTCSSPATASRRR
jgi:hypothetical protein